MLASVLSAKLAAAAVVTAGGLTAAAYADVLPAPVQNFAHHTMGAPAPHVAATPGRPGHPGQAGHASRAPSGPGASPGGGPPSAVPSHTPAGRSSRKPASHPSHPAHPGHPAQPSHPAHPGHPARKPASQPTGQS